MKWAPLDRKEIRETQVVSVLLALLDLLVRRVFLATLDLLVPRVL